MTPDEFTAVRRAVVRRGTLVTAPVGGALSAYYALWEPTFHGSRVEAVAFNLVEFFLFLIVIVFGVDRVLAKWLSPHARWAVDGEPPTVEDRRALVSLPVRAALWMFAVMLVITAATAIPNYVFSHRAVEATGVMVGLFLTGCTISAIVYLQTERALRPLFVIALANSEVPHRRSVGIRPRLLLAWVLGSALPLLFIVALPLRQHTGDLLPLTVPMLYMAIGGLLLGGITTLLAARSVAEPIETVRTGLEQVGDGDLETELQVTSPGDLGQLQAGFNEMVAGLRQRRQLEDLFGRHVGTEVARQAMGAGVELGGESRHVTVLFVDVIGSTAFAESHPPREVVSRINDLFHMVFDVISAAGGWINKFEGDGCLCIFGAPAHLPDHPARGLAAARTLGARAASADLPVGIGVSSGEVVAGNVGSIERFEYTVIGRPVNEAARLTEAAKDVPGHVLAAAQTVESAGMEGAHWEQAGDLALKGLSQSLPAARPRATVSATP